MINQVIYNGKRWGFCGKGITKGSAVALCGKAPRIGCYIDTQVGSVYNLAGEFYLVP